MSLARPRWGARAAAVVTGSALLLAALAAPVGAAQPPEPPRLAALQAQADPPDVASLAARLRRLARRDERDGRLQRALSRWQAAAALEPGVKQSAERSAALQRTLQQRARRARERAQAQQQAGKAVAAFRSYLHVLVNAPDDAEALHQVKYTLNARSVLPYTVQPGDTLFKIAQAQYGDGDLFFLVQAYNDIADPRDLEVGQTLRMPVLAGVWEPPAPQQQPPDGKSEAARTASTESAKAPKATPEPPSRQEQQPARSSSDQALAGAAPAAAPAPTKGGLAGARAALDAGELERAAALADGVLADQPDNGQAREVRNTAHYRQGERLAADGRYADALRAYEQVDDGFRDVARRREAVRAELDDDAESHYVAGVNYFLEEDLDRAIAEWERTLELDPDHARAARNLRQARSLKAKLDGDR